MVDNKLDMFKSRILDVEYSKNLFEKHKKEAKEELESLLKDEEIPLFNRWCLFMEHSSLFPVASSSISRAINYAVDRYYDLERYRTYTFSDIFEEYWFKEKELSNSDLVEAVKESFELISEKDVRSIIFSGYSGFEHDW